MAQKKKRPQLHISLFEAQKRDAGIMLYLPEEQTLSHHFKDCANTNISPHVAKTNDWITSRYKEKRVYNVTYLKTIGRLEGLLKNPFKICISTNEPNQKNNSYISANNLLMQSRNEEKIEAKLRSGKKNATLLKTDRYTVGSLHYHKLENGETALGWPYLDTLKLGLHWKNVEDPEHIKQQEKFKKSTQADVARVKARPIASQETAQKYIAEMHDILKP